MANSYKISYYRPWYKLRGIMFFLSFIIIPMLCSFVIGYILKNTQIQRYYKSLILILANYAVILTIYIVLLLCYNNHKIKRINFFSSYWCESLKSSIIPALFSFLGGIFIVSGVVYIVNNLPVGDFIKKWLNTSNSAFFELTTAVQDKRYFLLGTWVVCVTIFAPLSEEIIFRGFLQDSMQKLLKNHTTAVIMTATIFGLFHFESLSNILYAFFIGMILSHYRELTGKLNICVIIHAIVNLLGVINWYVCTFILKSI